MTLCLLRGETRYSKVEFILGVHLVVKHDNQMQSDPFSPVLYSLFNSLVY